MLDQTKISAKGVPSFLHNPQLFEDLSEGKTLSINSIHPDTTANIVGDNMNKSFINSIIPMKRYFVNKYYSKAFE